jgi:hypothetical protein
VISVALPQTRTGCFALLLDRVEQDLPPSLQLVPTHDLVDRWIQQSGVHD